MTKVAKFGLIGLILEIFTFLVMMGLFIIGKPLPDFLMWGFYIGLFLCLVAALWSYKSKDNASKNRKTVIKGYR
jgi:hypothetical protein